MIIINRNCSKNYEKKRFWLKRGINTINNVKYLIFNRFYRYELRRFTNFCWENCKVIIWVKWRRNAWIKRGRNWLAC